VTEVHDAHIYPTTKCSFVLVW